MKKCSIKYDVHRDVFWQKSYIENEEGQIFITVIICVDEVFLTRELKRKIEYIDIDNDIKKWFNKKNNYIFVTEKEMWYQKRGNVIIDVYPKIESMYYCAKNLLES